MGAKVPVEGGGGQNGILDIGIPCESGPPPPLSHRGSTLVRSTLLLFRLLSVPTMRETEKPSFYRGFGAKFGRKSAENLKNQNTELPMNR